MSNDYDDKIDEIIGNTLKFMKAEPVLEGKLKVYDYMMRQNKGVYIGEGYDLYGQKAVKTTKVSKKRNRYAKKPNRKHGLYNNNR